MKTTLFGILLLMNSVLVLAQERVGNGGSGDEAQLAAQEALLVQTNQKIKLFFIKNKAEMEKIFESVSSKVLSDTISRMNIEITNKNLVDRHGETRTCLNFARRGLVQCNYSLLKRIENDPKALFVLMFHEILGLMGLEETSPQDSSNIEGYKLSKKLAVYVTKVGEYDLTLSGQGVCGLNGNIQTRIQDCNIRNKEGFALVARTDEGIEVWKDLYYGLLWSDRLPRPMNHFDAKKACNSSLKAVAGISFLTWRLPSIDEFERAAEKTNRLGKVLPNMNVGDQYWSSTKDYNVNYIQPWQAWLFDARGFTERLDFKEDWVLARCVAR